MKRGMKKLRTHFDCLHPRACWRYSSYLALVVAPTEQTMGDVQRIFYYHVPSGWVAGLCFFINFLASVGTCGSAAPRATLWPRLPPKSAWCSAPCC